MAGHDLDLSDLIVPAGTPVPDERPVDLGGAQLALMVDGAAAVLAKVAEAHRDRAFPLRVEHLRTLSVALAGVLVSAREVVERVRHDGAHWAALPAVDERAPRWTGEAPTGFELTPGEPGKVRADLLAAVGDWSGRADEDLDLARDELLKLAALLSVWDQPARPVVESVDECDGGDR